MILKYLIYLLVGIGMIHTGYTQSLHSKDSLTILADSIHLTGNYKEALIIRKQALINLKNTSGDYYKYAKAKYYHTQSCFFENESYNYANPDQTISKVEQKRLLDSALAASTQARDIYINVKNPDKRFQYDLQNRIYHQTAFLGNWEHALEEARYGLAILRDTLTENDKKFVDLIYDIGYIYSQLGDYSKAVENFQKSLDLYQNIIGENHTDVAQAYNNISVEYRNLGLRKKELESLLKAKSIWERLNTEDDKRYLYTCYGNLFYWYSYYGDYDKAEKYMIKRTQLRDEEIVNKNGFIRNEEEAYKEKLAEWYDLMIHSLRKKDTAAALVYSEKIFSTIDYEKDNNTRMQGFEAKFLTSTLNHYSDILHEKKPEKAQEMLSMAIDVLKTYKTVYYTNPILYQIKKADLLIDQKKYREADTLLNHLIPEAELQGMEELFSMYILKGKISDAVGNETNAQGFFDKAFLQSVIHVDIPMEKANLEDLKSIISFEKIDGFIAMGDFYFRLFKGNHDKADLIKAFHRYMLASGIYSHMYLGQRYNNRLFDTYTLLNQRLLQCAYEDLSDKQLLLNAINEIENNGSKLTWSKFMYNNQRKQIKLPEQLLNEEEDVKAQLNFYNNKLYSTNEPSENKKNLWREKIYELEDSFLKIQDTIKKHYISYYQFNFQDFDIELLQKELDKHSAVIKYVITKDQLFSIFISEADVRLYQLADKEKIKNSLEKVFYLMQNRVPDYQDEVNDLKNLLLSQMPMDTYDNLTIVPDGFLYYLPFEILVFSENMPAISYSPTLLLFKEHQKISLKRNRIQLGAFAAAISTGSNSSALAPNPPHLTNANSEIENILHIFDGKAFINSTKEVFLEQANRFNILHLAMHSTISNRTPEQSSINFYGDKNNRLLISELYNETLIADMVVLSSCNTGSGLYENGEGVISLSRAFTFSGIPSVVMSLWKVPDKQSATIMQFFYKNLKKGQDKAKALKQAKLDYLNSTDDTLLKHPYYWAGFVISGDTSPIVSVTNYYLWGLLSIIIGLFIWMVLKRSIHFFK